MSEQVCMEKLFRACRITGERYERGTPFEFNLSLFKPDEAAKDLALYVLLEHNVDAMTSMLKEFMLEGLMPYGMIIFMDSAYLPPTLPGGEPRRMRAEELDQFGPDFTNFIIEELVPEACRISGETLSADPDLHFICGGSSGGLAAWNAVWFRNDYFRRAFLSSPTFSAMRGGEEAMVLARKTETKPIKVYITSGTEEPDYFFGSSMIAAQNAAYALEFAGYDFRFEQFNGEGHCTRREDVTLWRRMMAFLWANWKTTPVQPLFNQIRIRKLVADGSSWQTFEGDFPAAKEAVTNGGRYTFADGTIFLEKDGVKTAVAEGFGKISALGISSDKWRLYIADAARRFLYAMSILPDGSLDQLYKLAPLHLRYDFTVPGASDLAVLADDRILAATQLGIQGVTSFGMVDLILPLPGDLPAERITVCGNTLYAASGDRIFVRELKVSGEVSAEPVAPSTPCYGDNFAYNRSHLPCS